MFHSQSFDVDFNERKEFFEVNKKQNDSEEENNKIDDGDD